MPIPPLPPPLFPLLGKREVPLLDAARVAIEEFRARAERAMRAGFDGSRFTCEWLHAR